ncbi:MAG TPA: cyclodeaminase/cyclohydrolase family protein [Armatimonadota bacterium]|nr:cyclodeaminase/cyclohydrolase family protein [Armatimonadota bacterium]
MPDFLQIPVRQYLDQLASGEPTPGGGSAAGLAGAMGAALLCMSARFTVGREKYAQYAEAAEMVISVAEGLREKLQGLVEEDSAAYAQYRAALAMPKSNDEEKAIRRQALQAATKASALAPMAIARHCHQLLELAGTLAVNSNPNLVSDVAVATEMALGAFNSAVLNVRLNLKYLDDEAFVQQIATELAPLMSTAGKLAKSALDAAYQVMNLSIEGV